MEPIYKSTTATPFFFFSMGAVFGVCSYLFIFRTFFPLQVSPRRLSEENNKKKKWLESLGWDRNLLKSLHTELLMSRFGTNLVRLQSILRHHCACARELLTISAIVSPIRYTATALNRELKLTRNRRVTDATARLHMLNPIQTRERKKKMNVYKHTIIQAPI